MTDEARAGEPRTEAECGLCGREVIYDGSAEKWTHWVEPVPDGHAVAPRFKADEARAGEPRDATRDALEDMVRQFAYWSEGVGGLWTGGLSALEDAFDVLGWEDPHPAPDMRCDQPGCMAQASCGWPSPGGYRHTCGDHWDRP